MKNRMVKAAMSDRLSDPTGAPAQALERLYARWARGGAGMLITGNVVIDRRSLGEAGNIVVEDERDIAALRRWAPRHRPTIRRRSRSSTTPVANRSSACRPASSSRAPSLTYAASAKPPGR
jgi:hypothetical protein